MWTFYLHLHLVKFDDFCRQFTLHTRQTEKWTAFQTVQLKFDLVSRSHREDERKELTANVREITWLVVSTDA